MKPKRIVRIVLAVTLLTAALACCLAGMAMFGVFDDYQMKRAINPPNSAAFLFETDDYPMTNLEQKTLYYASSDDIDTIKAIYEKSGITFIGGNPENDWWVGAYNTTGNPQPYPTASPGRIQIQHWDFCPATALMNWDIDVWVSPLFSTTPTEDPNALAVTKKFEFSCIAITLVRADRSDLCRLDIFPKFRTYGQKETVNPFKRCDELPKQGTIIIYRYNLPSM